MIRHSMKLAACISIFGVAVLSNNAMAMNKQACEQLPGNMFLAAVERGECDINIQTAAGRKMSRSWKKTVVGIAVARIAMAAVTATTVAVRAAKGGNGGQRRQHAFRPDLEVG